MVELQNMEKVVFRRHREGVTEVSADYTKVT
jgi:hypothetical protein